MFNIKKRKSEPMIAIFTFEKFSINGVDMTRTDEEINEIINDFVNSTSPSLKIIEIKRSEDKKQKKYTLIYC